MGTVQDYEVGGVLIAAIFSLFFTSVQGQQTVCVVLVPPPYGFFVNPCGTSIGSTCTMGCQTGFELLGPCARVCQPTGIWSGQNPFCIDRAVTCPILQAPRNGLIVGNCLNIAGFMCTFACNPGYNLEGDTQVMCSRETGQWTGTIPRCILPRCPALTPPANGAFSGGTCRRRIGSVCQIICNPGFSLVGSGTLTCQADLTWSGIVPTCVGGCPDISPPANGVTGGTCTAASVGAVCTFGCNDGYALVGSASIVCQAPGTWTANPPVCQAIVCSIITAPENGASTGTCAPGVAGQTCSFVCSAGYQLTGADTIVCQQDGTWSADPPTCTPNNCPDVNPPVNGAAGGSCAPGVIGQPCVFFCDAGYTLQGVDTIICLADGTWTDDVPTCTQINCPDLDAPENGASAGNCMPGLALLTCSFGCTSGYVLNGDAVLTCQEDGTWSSAPPTCDPINCPDLEAPENGATSGNCMPGIALTTCSFGCSAGYVLNGVAELTCQEDGTWSSAAPTCDPRNCPNLDTPENGATAGNCMPGLVYTTCNFGCVTGYTLNGAAVLTCQEDGTWSSSPPTCSPINCPNIAAPGNGIVTGNCAPGVYGQTCTFACNNGYQLTGNAVLLCQENGLWNSAPPTCTAITCPNLDTPANGLMTGTCAPGIPEQTCTFACSSGFQLSGNQVLVCQADGTWSGSPPSCISTVRNCPNIGPIPYGVVSGICAPGIAGRSCNFACNPGYQLNGNAAIICQASGVWNSPPPTCTSGSCPTISAPSNGIASGACSLGTVGSRCSFVCNSGFKLNGNDAIICQGNGRWTGSPPTCDPVSCPAITAPANGIASGACSSGSIGSRCSFICNSGYKLTGSDAVMCQESGRWTASPPTCDPSVSCPSINPPAFGTVSGTCAPGRVGARCSFRCIAGYDLIGLTTVICQADRTWTGDPPTCRNTVTCPPLNPPSRGQISGSCRPGTVSGICTFLCQTGNTLSGNQALICRPDGTWTGTAPTCTPVTCPPLSPPAGGGMSGSCTSGTLGSICAFNCPSTSILRGNRVLMCQADGTWNGVPPICATINCPALTAPARGTLSGSCSPGIAGSRCNFNCQIGNTLIGNQVLVCRNDGTWSGAPPACNPINCPSLSPPLRGAMSGSCTPGTVGGLCTFTCQPGNNLNGNQILICQTDGTWSGAPPSCIPIICPALSPPIRGTMSGSCAPGTVDGICTFTCQTGNTLSGNQILTCQNDGSWSGAAPICIPVTCPDVDTPVDGALGGVCAPGSVGQSCTFVCNPGYVLTGPTSIVCQADGSWSDAPPVCTTITCAQVNPPMDGSTSGVCAPGQAGETCYFTCDAGFLLNGPTEITCQIDGTWTDSPPVCLPVYCDSVTSPANGVATGSCSPGVAGQTCIFTCNDGYTLNGQGTITCLISGSYDAPPPTCDRITCPNIDPVISGISSGSCAPGLAGDVCTFTCADGFELIGVTQITCLNTGEWTDSPPVCQRIECPSLSPPTNGDVSGTCDPGYAGEACVFVCNDGFQVAGDDILICLNDGSWSATPPLCSVVNCPDLNPPSNGAVGGNCAPGFAGLTCDFTCDPGYGLNGPSSLVCNGDGSWSGSPPTCVSLNCPPVAVPDGGVLIGSCDVAIPGDGCTLACVEGYRLVGTATLMCQPDGTWSANLPTCEPLCPDLTAPANGSVAGICAPGIPDQICVFTCEAGFDLVGTDTLTCQQDGTWSSDPPTCMRRVCPPVAIPAGGALSGSCNPGIPGGLCTVLCAVGYQVIGVPTIVCRADGTWSAPAATCGQVIGCPPYQVPQYGRVILCPTTIGSTCQLACNQGYTFTTPTMPVCQATGQWTIPQMQCRRVVLMWIVRRWNRPAIVAKPPVCCVGR